MKRLVAGNWKMNGTRASLAVIGRLAAKRSSADCDVLLCPPATLLHQAHELAQDTGLRIGGQDCHCNASGAHTGDISAEMLADAGASHVILGHSERRVDHLENDEAVAAKVRAAWRAGLVAIICVGETAADRDAGRTLDIVERQIRQSVPDGANAANAIIAYEPVWAIGTGRTATEAEIRDVHAFIRQNLAAHLNQGAVGIRVIYGGSVNPGNALAISTVPGVDGALVGGASLKEEDFGAIISAFSKSGSAC